MRVQIHTDIYFKIEFIVQTKYIHFQLNELRMKQQDK